jgi:hypothetical protein
LRIKSNTNVGVQVSDPDEALHVGGAVKIDTLATDSSNTSFLVEDGGVIKKRSGGATGATGADGPTGPTGGGSIAVELGMAVGGETSVLTTGTSKLTFRMPHAMTLTEVRFNVNTAPTGSVLTFDVNEGGTSILSTKVTIDAGEKTSVTATTPAVISDSALGDDAEITIDIDTVGSTIAGKGAKCWLIGTR